MVLKKNKIFPTCSIDSIKLLACSYSAPEMNEEEVLNAFIKCKLDFLKASPIDVLVLSQILEIEDTEKEFIKTQ